MCNENVLASVLSSVIITLLFKTKHHSACAELSTGLQRRRYHHHHLLKHITKESIYIYIYGDVVVGRCSWPAAAANALLMQNLRSEPDLNTQDLDKRDHHRTQNQSEHALAFSLMIYCFGDKSIMLELHECMKGTHVMNAS